jgi:hypothetical protein
MSGVSVRIQQDIELARSDAFTGLCRSKATDFTRRRKLPVGPLVLSVLARKGRALALEVRDLGRYQLTGGGISVPGYLKQRLKLNPLALLTLARHHAAQFYGDDTAVRCFKGMLLVAVDGSSVNVPTTDETIAVYGNASGAGRPQAACGISCMYDVLNRQVINLTINRGGFDERAQVMKHAGSAGEVVAGRPFIFVGDRGYPSLALFADLVDAGVWFVVRASSKFLTAEFNNMESDDEEMIVELSPARLAQQRKKDRAVYERLKQRGRLPLRCVKTRIGDTEERLITNLPPDRFPAADLAGIYQLRWGVETVFAFMKDKLQLENFTAAKPVCLEQDIYAVAYLVNVISDLAQQAERELRAQTAPSGYKHEITVNKSFAIGVVKDEIIRFVLAPDALKEQIMAGIVTELARHITPIRKDRSYERNLALRHNRYHNTHKRVF